MGSRGQGRGYGRTREGHGEDKAIAAGPAWGRRVTRGDAVGVWEMGGRWKGLWGAAASERTRTPLVDASCVESAPRRSMHAAPHGAERQTPRRAAAQGAHVAGD